MTDTSGIISTITSKITTNGVQAITATVLSSVLIAMVMWISASFAPMEVIYLNATCDGVAGSTAGTDNTAAINSWLAQAASGKTLRAPQGVCNFTGTLSLANGITLNHITVKGQGDYSTTFQYVGTANNIDLFDVGAGSVGDGNFINGIELSGFRITSTTLMTAGWGLHLWHTTRGKIDVVIDGQDGTGNLYNGIWFDETDILSVPWVDAAAKNEVVRVNGSRQSEGWWPNYVGEIHFGHGKIAPPVGAATSIGLHVGGGVGGLTCDDVDIIANQFNLVVNEAVTGTGNQTVNTGQCFFDSPRAGGASILLDDNSANTQWQGGVKIVTVDKWAAGAPGIPAIWLKNWTNGELQVNGVVGGGNYGIQIDDAAARVQVSSTALIVNSTSYGIYSSVASPQIFLNNPSTYGNGADLNANALGSVEPMYYSGSTCPNLSIAIGGTALPIGDYSIQDCTWQLSGFTVDVDFGLALTTKGATTGTLTLAGLPVMANSAFVGGSGEVGYYTNWSGLSGQLMFNVSQGGTYANIYQSSATGVATTSNTNLTNTSTLYGNLTYRR